MKIVSARLAGTIFVVVGFGRTTIEARSILQRCGERIMASRSERLALVTLVCEDAPLPTSEARRELASHLRGMREHVVAATLIFEADSLRAASVRAVISAILALSRNPLPYQIYSNTTDALHWITDVYVNPVLKRADIASTVSRQINRLK